MENKILIAVAVMLFAAAPFAARAEEPILKQTKETESIVSEIDTISVDYTSKYHSSFFDNWSINAAGTAKLLFAEEDASLGLCKRIAPAWKAGLTKEIIPDISLRCTFGMGKMYGWNSGVGGEYKWEADWLPKDPVKEYYESLGQDCSGGYKEIMEYANVDLDALFNILNIVNNHTQGVRRVDIYGFLGLEYFQMLRRRGYYPTKKVGFNFGGLLSINLTNRLSLTTELSALVMDATFDNEIGKGMGLNCCLNASLGLNVRIGHQGYNVERLVTPRQYVKLQEVTTKIVEEYEETYSIREIINKEATVSNTGTLLAPSIVFDEGEITFSEELQMVNLYRMARYMEKNPRLKIIVIGNIQSCDNHLARRRAELIRSILIERYGIAPDRLRISLQNVNLEYRVSGQEQTVNFGALL